jgi:hypothetical protein
MKNRKKNHPSAVAIGVILTPLHAHSAEPADIIVLPDIEVTHLPRTHTNQTPPPSAARSKCRSGTFPSR